MSERGLSPFTWDFASEKRTDLRGRIFNNVTTLLTTVNMGGGHSYRQGVYDALEAIAGRVCTGVKDDGSETYLEFRDAVSCGECPHCGFAPDIVSDQ